MLQLRNQVIVHRVICVVVGIGLVSICSADPGDIELFELRETTGAEPGEGMPDMGSDGDCEDNETPGGGGPTSHPGGDDSSSSPDWNNGGGPTGPDGLSVPGQDPMDDGGDGNRGPITFCSGNVLDPDCYSIGVMANPTFRNADMPYGDFSFLATDLVVSVTGQDFRFSRSYTSNPDYDGADLLGVGWHGSSFLFLKVEAGAEPDIILVDLQFREHVFEYNSTEGKWLPVGASDQYIIDSDVTIGSDKYAVWRLVSPGRWETNFYREHDATGGFTATPEDLERLLLLEQDPYGNERIFEYTIYGTDLGDTGKEHARLASVTMTASGETSYDAKVNFEWLETGTNKGRLSRLTVLRKSGMSEIETQRVDYIYKSDGDGNSDATGTAGDLIDVRRRIKLDNSSTAPDDTWRIVVSQYRYHGGESNETTVDFDLDGYVESGAAHQVKSVLMPEQVEYFAQRHAEEVNGPSVDTVDEAADVLLTLGDADDWHTNITDRVVVDLASTIAAVYETGGDARIVDQYVMSACGCGGGYTQGLYLNYDYYSFTSGGYTDSVEIIERHDDGGGGWTTWRTLYYDFNTPGASSVPFLINKAIIDGSDKWVTHFERDSTTRLPTKYMTPSAMNTYSVATHGTPDAAPNYTAKSSDGLVYAYAYSADGPYLLEIRMAKGDAGAFANFDHFWKATRGDSSRPWLTTKIERFQDANSSAADDIETVEFNYQFHTNGGQDLAWIEIKAEAELESENGPSGSGNTYDSYVLIDAKGRKAWARSADNTLTAWTWDTATGRIATITRNSSNGTGGSWGYSSPLGIGTWGGSGDDLKVNYTLDLLGRPTKIEQFSSSSRVTDTFFVREMKDLAERDGIKYLAKARFPHVIAGGASGSYAGMATVSWIGAGGKVLRSSGYEPDASGGGVYDTDPIANALGDELTKTVTDHSVSGLVEARHSWYDVSELLAKSTTEYTYDELGRVETVKSPEGTFERYTYDVLDRRIKKEIGTDDDPSTGNMKTVTEWFHDSGGTATPGVGNGNVTLIRQHVDDSTTRDTKVTYDHRDRPVKTENAIAPHSYTVYDNLNRVIETAVFKSIPTDIETPLADRGGHTVTHYSQRGKVYLVQNPIDPAEDSAGMGFSGFLETNTWFDEVGRSIATWSPSSPGRKTVYDDLGRVETVYVTDRGGDDDPGAAGNYADASDVTGDLIIEQAGYRYIADTTLADLATRRARAHDASSSDTGALDALASAKKITTYSASYYDGANRPIRSVMYGTNTTGFVHGGSAPTVNQASPPDHNTAGAQLVHATSYNERGMVQSTTDPEGAETRTFYDDMNRRVAVIENYDDATVSWDPGDKRWEITGLDIAEPDTDRGVTFTYDDSSNLILRIAFLPKSGGGEDIQETEYDYGVLVTSGNNIASNDMLDRVNYPDEGTGGKGSTTAYRFNYEYNRQGETIFTNDQNRIQHVFTRDARGRVTKDEITGWGSATNIDQWIDRIETTYDSFGRQEFVRSKDGSTIMNAVKFKYDARWRVSELWQDHDGDIDENGMGTNSQVVEYAYDDAKMADGNYARLESITYPDDAVIDTDYGTASALNDVISRAEAIKIGSDTIVSYDFVGSGMFAKAKYPQSEIRLDRTVAHNGSRTSGQYPGWDAFGRIENQVWVDDSLTTHATDSTVPSIPPIVELEYAYDKSNNRTHKYDVRPGALRAERDQQYTYDGLERLTEAKRGAWNGTSFTLGNDSEKWTLDMLGNWEYLDTDFNGDGTYSTTTERDDRTHNSANELTQRILKGQDGMGGDDTLALTFDDTGNIWEADRAGGTEVDYKQDGWNRLVETKFGSNVRAEYEYNGLNWRTVATLDADATHDGVADQERVMYYDQSWRLIEERIDDDLNVSAGADRTLQYLWGNRYVDDIAFRRENADLTNDSPSVTYNSNWNYLTDAMFSVIAIVKERNAVLAERVRYDAYGNSRHQRPGDVDGDGDTDGADNAAYLVASGKGIGQAGYNVDADVNRDGTVDSTDGTLITNDFGSALAKGQLSNIDNVIGFDGYVFNAPDEVYTVRNRSYDLRQGRWINRDPIEYADGANRYQYVNSRPVEMIDPSGLATVNGPEATIFTWLPGGFASNAVWTAFNGLGGILFPELYRASVFAQVNGANLVGNPSPPTFIGIQPNNPAAGAPWYATTFQHRGYLAVKASLECCDGDLNTGSLTKWSHQGWTPNPTGLGPPFIPAEMHPGHPMVTLLPPTGPQCSRWKVTMASRVDIGGQAITGLTSFALPPYINREIEYEICCDGKYKVDYRGSRMPAHGAYINGGLIGSHIPANADFAYFIWYGITNANPVMPVQHITTASN